MSILHDIYKEWKYSQWYANRLTWRSIDLSREIKRNIDEKNKREQGFERYVGTIF